MINILIFIFPEYLLLIHLQEFQIFFNHLVQTD